MIKLKGIYLDLLESKQTEAQGLNILKKANVKNPESVIQKFAEADQSKNQKNIPLMSYLYSTGYDNTDLIISTVNDYWKLEDNKKLAPYQLSKEGINIGGKTFKDFIKFSEHIHSELDKQIVQKKLSIEKDFEADAKPIWSDNGIDIYEGDSVGKCIQYTQGGLTGASYSFCIGQPGSANMYKSYRDTAESSFYFIVDKNRFRKDKDGTVNLEDPLHIVVFDNSSQGIQLTDANNTTGTIEEFGNDANSYVDYLKSKGVPVEKLVRKPKTKEEEEEEKLLGRRNPDKEFFEKLSYEQKSNYIGRGHTLTDEQFDILYDDKDDFLISKYVDTGLKITKYQFDKLTNKQEKTYLRKRFIAVETGEYKLEDYEYSKLTDNQKQLYVEKQVEKGRALNDQQYKDASDDVKQLYIEKIEAEDGISGQQYRDTPDSIKQLYIEKRLEVGYLLNDQQYKDASDNIKKFYIKKLINTGYGLDDLHYKDLSDNQKQLYIKKRIKAGYTLSDPQYEDAPYNQKQLYIKKRIKEGYTLSDLQYKDLSDNQKQLYIEKRLEGGYSLNDQQYKDASDDLKQLYIEELLETSYLLDDQKYKDSSANIKQFYIEKMVKAGYTLSDPQYEVTPNNLKQYYFELIKKNTIPLTNRVNYYNEYQTWLKNNS